jgi:hypothetical protein
VALPALPLKPHSRLAPLAWAGLVYLLNCLLGVWSAYDPALAWWRFGQIVCGLALVVPVACIAGRGGPNGLRRLGLGYVLLAASVGIAYGLAIRVRPEAPARFGPLRQVALWIVGHRPLSINSDVSRAVAFWRTINLGQDQL